MGCVHLCVMYGRVVPCSVKGSTGGWSPLKGGAGRPLPGAAAPRTFMNKFAGIASAADVQAYII